MSPPAQTWTLTDPDLLQRLMKRTGDGRPVTTRALGTAAGCSASYISNLIRGIARSVPADIAHRLCARLGVDVLVLFTPNGRTVPDPDADEALVRASA